MKWSPSEHLNTGLPDLNRVIGHKDKGIPYGKMIEISGWESSAKTANTLALAAIAQRDGALVIWGDLENSWEPLWAVQRGIAPCEDCKGTGFGKDDQDCPKCLGSGADPEKLILIKPYVGKFGNEREERLSSAQELLAEMEAALSLISKKTKQKKFVVLDSIAALLTEGEDAAGIGGANMRSDMDLPKLMGRLCRRWVGRAQVYNAVIVLINQLREGPGGMGPKTPGGNAPRFYSHVRIRIARVMGSKIISKGRTIGIKGIMTAKKNKCGGEEGAQIGFRLIYAGALEFVPAKNVMPKDGD